MKEHDLIYLAGLVDGVGNFEVNVSPHDNYATGFRFEPKIRLGLREWDTAVLGMLDEYCEECGVEYTLKERKDSTSVRFTVQEPCNIVTFIEPFGDYLIRKHEDAHIMINEVIPKVKDGKHREKRGFYELMEYVDELRSPGGRTPKYTQEWFEDEWGTEISAE